MPHIFLGGAAYTEELLNSHPRRFFDTLRLSSPVFLRLQQWITTRAMVKLTCRNYNGVTTNEQLAIFFG